MNQRKLFLTGSLAAFAACTYNEVHNTYITPTEPDAGAPVSAAGTGGTSGAGGTSAGGSAGTSAGGSGAGAGGGSARCSGCLALEMPATPARALGLAFDDEQNFSNTNVSWRVRVRDFEPSVFIAFYAESGSDENERIQLGQFELTAAAGWQTFGADFAALESFRAPTLIDGGGVAGGGFDSGFPFDKSEVERIAFLITTNQPSGVLTPLSVEFDELRFADRPALDRDFAAEEGGFELIRLFTEPTEGASLVHVPG